MSFRQEAGNKTFLLNGSKHFANLNCFKFILERNFDLLLSFSSI
jgi:hypothetical protein